MKMKIVSVGEMQEIDQKAIQEIGIPSLILMENAGRCVADIAMEMLGSARSHKKVAIFCGTGNNGGDGFVAARHLFNKGVKVSVYLIGKKSALKDDPKINASILENIGVKIKEISGPVDIDGDLIIDAIFGIGLKGEVKELAGSIITSINKKAAPVISVDVPSGLDADTGKVLAVAIKADTTVTMQFPKKGFYLNSGPEYTGRVVVTDIGVDSCAA
jgi:NAD(P)H-hydrate epimerase